MPVSTPAEIPHTAPCPCPDGPEQIYEAYFGFVWRNLRRLGVPEAATDDAAQDVFLVVFRRYHEFEGRSSVRTWLFGILLRVARDHRKVTRAVRHGCCNHAPTDAATRPRSSPIPSERPSDPRD